MIASGYRAARNHREPLMDTGALRAHERKSTCCSSAEWHILTNPPEKVPVGVLCLFLVGLYKITQKHGTWGMK